MEELRDYQQEMLSRLNRAWKRKRSVMVQMPMGTGKTHLMAAVISEASTAQGGEGGTLVVAHRRELLEQIRQTLAAFGLSESGVWVESIQKISKRIDTIDFNPSLVVVDEAHHALASSYRMLWERWPKAKFLGLTATPCRLNGEGFTELFSTLLQAQRISTFISQGWLSDFEYVSAHPDSMAMRQVGSLRKRGADGDYQTKEMALVLDVPESVANLYTSYATFARGRKGIVYAIDREHARHIADYYSARGVKACWIEAKTPAKERQRLVEEYRRGMVDVIVNVDIFSEGFDCPEVEFIQLARPTLSLSKFLQQVGRGMRVSMGKGHVLILDQVGLYQTFGLPTVDRDWEAMFLGKETGRGMTDISRCAVVSEGEDKMLASQDMIRIKRVGEKGAGLEVFLQDGRYGIMNNGRITCPARFRRVERLQRGCGFFALGVYLQQSKHGVGTGHTTEVTTVIDRYGRDLQVRLYGAVRWQEGYFYGEVDGGTYFMVNCWDPVGNAYYDAAPKFTKVAGVEIASAMEHGSEATPCMRLRYSTGRVSPRFNRWEMLYNKDIIIARDYLVVKRDHNHAYRIRGYLDGCVLVESEERYGFQQIAPDGSLGMFYSQLPRGASRAIDYRRMGLQRVRQE